MIRARRSWGAAVIGALAMGCASPAEPASDRPDACAGTTQQPIVNGAAGERYLGLSASQIRSLVPIVDGTNPEFGALCSGTFVSADWVLTAAHCLEVPSAEVRLAKPPDPPVHLSVVQTVVDPGRSIALLRVSSPAPLGAGGISPLAIPEPGTRQPAPGDAVELAGYGLTETAGSRSLRFLVETITAVDDETLTVDGFGATGACAGDSGGPLLMRAADGSVLVAGALWLGSEACTERDEYARIDRVRDWVLGVIGPAPPANHECGTISAEGRCLYGAAHWCDGGALVSESCSGGRVCGWDGAQAGFRCVEPALDPCRGVDGVGLCQGGAVSRCRAGTLEKETCRCGTRCRVDGATGSPVCVGDR